MRFWKDLLKRLRAGREPAPVVVFVNLPDLGGKMLWADVVMALRDKQSAPVRAMLQLLILQMSRGRLHEEEEGMGGEPRAYHAGAARAAAEVAEWLRAIGEGKEPEEVRRWFGGKKD